MATSNRVGTGDTDRVSTKMIVAGGLAVLAIVFILQNTGTGTVNLLWMDIEAPGWVWFFLLFLAGVVVGSIFPWFRRRR